MKVSVLIITYNQENFITQAVNSVLRQKVNFNYEIIIGEDCSTDKTRDFLINLKKKNPDRLRLIMNEKNVGKQKNFIKTFKNCKGEYIAILEGDDYWTSPYKLQRQVNFLDSHQECSECFHNVLLKYENDSIPNRLYHQKDIKTFFNLEDLVDGNFIPSCSTMFRSGLFDEFPEWYNNIPMCDWPLHIFNAHHGNIAYINKVMAVHRLHTNGSWHSLNRIEQLKARIYAAEIIDRHLNYKFTKKIRNNISQYNKEIANILEKKNAENKN